MGVVYVMGLTKNHDYHTLYIKIRGVWNSWCCGLVFCPSFICMRELGG